MTQLDNHERAILTWLMAQKMPTTLAGCWYGCNLPEKWWIAAMGRLKQRKLIVFKERTGKAPMFITMAGRQALEEEKAAIPNEVL